MRPLHLYSLKLVEVEFSKVRNCSQHQATEKHAVWVMRVALASASLQALCKTGSGGADATPPEEGGDTSLFFGCFWLTVEEKP